MQGFHSKHDVKTIAQQARAIFTDDCGLANGFSIFEELVDGFGRGLGYFTDLKNRIPLKIARNRLSEPKMARTLIF